MRIAERGELYRDYKNIYSYKNYNVFPLQCDRWFPALGCGGDKPGRNQGDPKGSARCRTINQYTMRRQTNDTVCACSMSFPYCAEATCLARRRGSAPKAHT